jgi:hypothetical protein
MQSRMLAYRDAEDVFGPAAYVRDRLPVSRAQNIVMHKYETMQLLKKVLKFILYAGAGVSCLAGLWVVYVAIANFKEMQYPEWMFVLALELIFVCMAFTPAFMFLKKLKTKTWHWVVISVVEAIVIGIASYAILAWMAISMSNPG